MFNQKSIIVLYIDRGRLMFFGGNLSGVVTLDLPAAIARDLEIVNRDALYTFIKQWMKQVNLAPCELFVVIAESTYFEKIIPNGDVVQIETEAIRFFDTVPFESIWAKVYPAQTARRAIAINKTYIDAVCQAFALQGFTTRAVVPVFTLGEIAKRRVFDGAVGQYVLRSVDALSKYNIIEPEQTPSAADQPAPAGEKSTKRPKNTSLPFLLGAFGFLIVVLVILVITQMG